MKHDMKYDMKYGNKSGHEGKAPMERMNASEKRLKEMAAVAKRGKKLPGTTA